MTSGEGSAERKKSENTLVKEEERLLRAEKFAHLGHWHFSLDDMILTSSDEMNRIYGYDPTIHRMTLDEGVSACHPDDLEQVQSAFDSTIATGVGFDYEHRIVRTDGEVRAIHAKTECELDDDQNVVSIFGIIQDITERRQTEDALRESEAKFRAIAESAPVAVAISDLSDGTYLYCNDKVSEMLGLPPGAALGRKASEFFVEPDEREALAQKVQDAGELRASEIKLKRQDGTMVWGIGSARQVSFEGRPANLSVVMDITERKQAEDELERIFDLSPDMIGSGNLEGYFTRVNSSFEQILGYGINEFCEKPFLEYVHEEDVEVTKKALIDAATGKQKATFSTVNRYRCKDGTFKWIEWHVQAFVKENSFYAVGWDITERKQAEDNLRKLSRAVEQSSNAIFITDTSGTIEYINSKFTDLTGYTREESLGKNSRILKSDDTPRQVYAEMWSTITANKEWKGEIKDRCKNGDHFWAYEIISPVTNEKNQITHYVATHEDISKRRAAELATQYALEQAEEANRAKSDLMANMSHELRTPLNAIIGFSEFMKDETFGSVGSAKNREYLNDIYNSGRHLLDLINDILDASALEAGALELHEENVSVASVVESSVRLTSRLAEEGRVSVTSSSDLESIFIFADERRVTQVMLNLLSNAIKFTPEGGEVSVHCHLNDYGALVISVADTGAGMDDKEIEKALSRFGQVDSGLDRKHEGTGLGLPLTKGLMKLHGGALEIKSEKGHGTLITITFPKERVV